ncbi:4a-hydroxytetrahydrobiopterin dehydratase [Glutamicibacter sp. MNS18]|uniref:4a-hydroxytetrahydrobiopterin dehydratase n=1 Tax=Glutamicibacter sp. MNS18 TaxID=2989817 RepID=UPI002236ADB5|nr:4a-hydroxytetrahydrobiopterin dehydratase [Glutamicibacter sp. MNS18]MCW4465395.1 4a-hydroxytetrahydrobiopterin dehydratase [Glutamicibacter sp. MNS18]
MTRKEVLNDGEIQNTLSQLPPWRYGLGALRTVYKCPSAASALQLLASIGSLAEEANHHPDVDWRYDTLFLTLASHDSGGVTTSDTLLAGRISEQAESLGAGVDLNLVRTVEICIDTDNPRQISSIWRTALGYREEPNGSLTDPHGRGPAIWFQETETPSDNRFHLDVTVPHSHSGDVLEKLKTTDADLDYENSPAWVVATDYQGNRLCICTEAGRG